ncbi:hypothetical protein [Streptomyces sp. NRRL S-15]|uniref:hypothetical protein n=1 Tax=Streptomyces sp. NRRL S-15 TaxID=1463886 RepID=UPI00099BB325|nr:hypothetical protein [Streptomyces sp. NRRL S-15]
MTNTEERVEDACPLTYQCRLPLSMRTVNHLADLLRRHLKAIRSRWRINDGAELENGFGGRRDVETVGDQVAAGAFKRSDGDWPAGGEGRRGGVGRGDRGQR